MSETAATDANRQRPEAGAAHQPEPGERRGRRRARMHTMEMPVVPAEYLSSSRSFPRAYPRPLQAALVMLGGGAGSALRWLFSVWEPATFTPTLIELPLATLTVNLVGCLLLGMIMGVLEQWRSSPRWLRPLFGVGFCGGFTTMSTVVLEGAAMVGADFVTLALTYACITLVGGILAATVGHVLSGWTVCKVRRWRS